MLKLTNTLTGATENFTPADGTTVRMYTCGPTVHDFAHIGNFRTYVFEDVLRRHLKSKWKLVHVMNITDIDDKIMRKAAEQGIDIRVYTAPYTAAFFEDSARLRIEKPDVITVATDYIPEMIDLVERLLANGHAYREGNSIYFRISSFPAYGRLSRLDRRELKVGARIDADEYEKEQPNDFVLWKAPKDNTEPRWDAPFGTGRPGWHLECSAMAMKQLGETLDIHCGGVDNIFPHHENEIAQSESATSKPFARRWVHGEHLLIEGEKMAKSKGNFYTLRDLLEKGFSAQAIRYLLLSVQYRKQLNFTMDGLAQAQHSLDRIREFVFRLQTARLQGGTNPELTQTIATARNQFEAGLDDDLNTPQALGAVFNLIRASNIALDRDQLHEEDRAAILAWLAEVDTRLAIIPSMEDLGTKDDEIEGLISGRNEARRNRNFAEADRLRQELLDRGIVIEDTREGTKWRRK
ncbi:MAG TPA: cysteine--tRNA ligase [Terriglobia bacterium]|nr:cysteine--tRNA ligase [Terriglobia bacterium]